MTDKEIVPVDKDEVYKLAYDFVVIERKYKKLLAFVDKIANKHFEFEELSHVSWDATHLLQEINE